MFHTDKLTSYLVFGLIDNEAFDVTKNRLIPFKIVDQQQRDRCQNFSSGHNFMDKSIDCRGKTLCQNNRQLIGMSLIGIARQAKKNRN